MRETEAAAFLSINPRTLYRYRKSGRLAFREVPGKTRPVIEYEEADLQKLKLHLDTRRTSRVVPAPPAPAKSKRIAFGMPIERYEELSLEAAKYAMSVPEYARRLVRDGLESRFQTEARELRVEIKRLAVELSKTRREYEAAFEALLEFVGLTPEEAKKWVTHNLR